MSALIEDNVPVTWQNLETRVAQILRDDGMTIT